MQNTLRKPEDLDKHGYQIEVTNFDYGLEFSRIQYIFVKIINIEVLIESGFFYWSDDTTEDNGYPTKALGLSNQSQVCFFDCTPLVTLL
jgi:hypothetical protein